jgi:hypothetical protein
MAKETISGQLYLLDDSKHIKDYDTPSNKAIPALIKILASKLQ